MLDNLLLQTDSYKASHWKQYPPETEYIYSYLESRGASDPFEPDHNYCIFFGLQYLIKKHLVGRVVTQDKIDEAALFYAKHFGNENMFNREGWEYILNKYDGHLPIEIRAVPEGSKIPNSNALVVVVNTDEKCFWLTNFLETLLVRVWYPITVSTLSYSIKQIIGNYLDKTAKGRDGLAFKLHDFGYRGVSSSESAALGGAAHLVNFMGTDTLAGCELLMEYYGDEMPGFSVAASEHSTITSWGRENELEAYANMLDQYPDGIVACVSDSYDIYNACENLWGTQLKERIMNRNGTLVIRPDCYDDQTEILTKNGWKYFKDLTNQDDVAAYTTNKAIRFQKPSRIINQKYIGQMYYFTADKMPINLYVTPNHRMIYEQGGQVMSKKAEDVKYFYGKKHLCAGLKEGSVAEISDLDRIRIAFSADGSFDSGNNQGKPLLTGQYKIRFNLTKDRKVKRLEDLCKKANIKYEKKVESSRPQNTQIYIWFPEKIIKTLDWVDFTNKNWAWCKQFIEEVSNWDSHIRDKNRIKFDTTVKENAEIVQLACLYAGYRTKYSIYKDNRSIKYSDVHTIHIVKQDWLDSQCIQTEKIDYDGIVYCVTVPSGMIVVRRNNQVSISGNSGDPITVIQQILNILGDKFGYELVNNTYKLLPDNVRIIQGDGIDRKMVRDILDTMMNNGWSAENIAFGSGGALLQKMNRDSLKFAFKCCNAQIAGQSTNVLKDPITDPGKKSKAGRLTTLRNVVTGDIVTRDRLELGLFESEQEIMRTVFRNGKLLIDEKLADIRFRLEQQ